MPRLARKQAKVRLNLDMPEKTREQLEGLRERTDADSLSEVVRRALAVYDFLWERKAAGSVTIVRSSDGSETQLQLL